MSEPSLCDRPCKARLCRAPRCDCACHSVAWLCGVEGCSKPYYCQGVCRMHHERMRLHGSYDDPRPTFEERFWSKVEKTDGCWLWRGGLNADGYGQFHTARPRLGTGSAHRTSYIMTNGPIADPDLELDHLCRVRNCVRPDHLELVTASENVRRAYGDHCRRGHSLTPENTYTGAHGRQCRECIRIRRRKAA